MFLLKFRSGFIFDLVSCIPLFFINKKFIWLKFIHLKDLPNLVEIEINLFEKVYSFLFY